jgi:hypothetical protein
MAFKAAILDAGARAAGAYNADRGHDAGILHRRHHGQPQQARKILGMGSHGKMQTVKALCPRLS